MPMEQPNGISSGQMPQQLQMLPHVLAQQALLQQQPQPQPQPPQQGQQQPSDVLSVLSETTCVTWVAIGLLAESLGDLDKAYSLYELALRFAPMNPEALTRIANICRSRDQFRKAAEYYETALNVHQENGDTWGLLGHCYLMMDDLQRAYAAYQRALYYLDNPNVPRLWHGIGILYDRYGSLEYAEEAFVRVLDLDPNFEKSNEIYFRLGIIYKHQAKYQNALDCFRYILSNPPLPLTQPDVWFQIGTVFEQQKNWNGAKEAYEKVLEVNPNHAKVLQQLGCLYSQAEPATQQQGQANSMPFQQDLTLALKYLLQSIEADSGDAHSWYYLGRVHMLRGDFNAAYEAFQQAVNRDSRNPTFWCSIGVLYYQISQYRDALDAYTRAIRLNPYISEVWYDLGTLYETCNNQISDALDAYRQAERLDPSNPHIKARLEQLIKYQQDGNTHPPQPPPVNQQPRLPQGMVLESTQPQHPQQAPLGQGGALPGPSQHQAALPLQPGGPAAPQPQLGQTVGLSAPLPHQQPVPQLQAQGLHAMEPQPGQPGSLAAVQPLHQPQQQPQQSTQQAIPAGDHQTPMPAASPEAQPVQIIPAPVQPQLQPPPQVAQPPASSGNQALGTPQEARSSFPSVVTPGHQDSIQQPQQLQQTQQTQQTQAQPQIPLQLHAISSQQPPSGPISARGTPTVAGQAIMHPTNAPNPDSSFGRQGQHYSEPPQLNGISNGQKHSLEDQSEPEGIKRFNAAEGPSRTPVSISGLASNEPAASTTPVPPVTSERPPVNSTLTSEDIQRSQSESSNGFSAVVTSKVEPVHTEAKSEVTAELAPPAAAIASNAVSQPSTFATTTSEPAEASTRDDDEEEEEDNKPAGDVEPPTRKVQEEEDYDED